MTDVISQASAHFERGEFKPAVAVCRRALIANPGLTEVRLMLGRALMALGHHSEVLAEMRVLLEREPGRPGGLALKGEALLRQGRGAEAAHVLRQARDAAPDDASIRALYEQASAQGGGAGTAGSGPGATRGSQSMSFIDEEPGEIVTRHYSISSGMGGLGRNPAGASQLESGGEANANELIDDLLDSNQLPRASSLNLPRRGPAAGGVGRERMRGRGDDAERGPTDGRDEDSSGFDEPTAVFGDGVAGLETLTADDLERAGLPVPPPMSELRARVAADPSISTDNWQPIQRSVEQPVAQPVEHVDLDDLVSVTIDSATAEGRAAVTEPKADDSAEMTFVASELMGASSSGPVVVADDDPAIIHSDEYVDDDDFDEDQSPTAMIEADGPWRAVADGALGVARPVSMGDSTLESAPPLVPPRESEVLPESITDLHPGERAPARPGALDSAARRLGVAETPLVPVSPARVPSASPYKIPTPSASSERPIASAPLSSQRPAAPEPPAMPGRPIATAPLSSQRPVVSEPPAMPGRPIATAPLSSQRPVVSPPGAGGPAGEPQYPSYPTVAPPTPGALPGSQPESAIPGFHNDGALEPTLSVPRKQRSGRRLLYGLVAAVVVVGGVLAGLQLRSVRIDWEVQQAQLKASEHLAADTYAGYTRARDTFREILEVRDNRLYRAQLARVEAARAAEFGAGYVEAEEAVAALGAVAEVEPDSAEFVDLVIANAYLAIADGDAKRAQGLAETLEEAAPDEAYGPYLSGRAQLLSSRYSGAREAFERALSLEPRAIFYVELGHTLLALGRYDAAVAAFDAALERVDGLPAALLGRAAVALEREDAPTESAAEALGAELEALIDEGSQPLPEQPRGVSPAQVAEAALRLVSLRSQRGDDAGARAILERVREFELSGDPGFSVALARVLERLGEHESALAQAQSAIERWPDRLDARTTAALIALKLGDIEAARAALISDVGGAAEADAEPAVAARWAGIERNALALSLRGQIFAALGEREAALRELDAALVLSPGLPSALLARVEIELERGQAETAVARLVPLVTGDQVGSARAQLLYAAALRRVGRLDEARVILIRLRAAVTGESDGDGDGDGDRDGDGTDGDGDGDGTDGDGDGDGTDGDGTDAADTVDEIEGIADLDRGRLYLELGQLERARGDLDAAARVLTEAVATAGDYALPAQVALALLGFDRGARAKACTELAAVVERVPDDSDQLAEILIEAARVHILCGRRERAERWLGRAEALPSPPRAAIDRERGRLLLREERAADAVQALTRARSSDPEDAGAARLQLEAALAVRDLEAAQAARDDLVALVGEDAIEAHIGDALLAAGQGEHEAALAGLDKVLRQAEQDQLPARVVAEIGYLYGRVLFEVDNLRVARQKLKSALELDPDNAEAYLLLGKVEYGRGELSAAIAAFEDALKRDPDALPEAWFYLGEIQTSEADERAAKRALRGYLKRWPDGAQAEDAKELLSSFQQ